MKTIKFLFLLSIISLLSSCKCEGPMAEKITFSGIVVSGESPISDALVKVNDDEVKSGENGFFSISVAADQVSYLVSVDKLGFGLYSRSFTSPFTEKKINLTKGTIIEFDPTVDNELIDTNSDSTIMQSNLTSLDTSLLFNTVPKVYDHTGQLIDLGYPPGLENIFDYVKEPITRRPGMRLNLRANTLRSQSGNDPPSGTMLRASLSTVDFFNPDGMPGDFVVRYQGSPRQFDRFLARDTSKKANLNDNLNRNESEDAASDRNREERLAFMESFGAATIEISDGDESYNLKEGETATVTIPIYEIRKKLGETLPPAIPLLHYNETDGVWEVTGTGLLNETRDAYVGEVSHFSTINFDLVKTGDSKCFKVRQILVNGAYSGTASPTYRAHIIIPESATSTFDERQRDVDESTGCVTVDGTSLHGITRIPNDVPQIVAVFSQSGVGSTDTLDIAIVNAAPTSIAAETAVAAAGDCSTACDTSVLDCSTATDANNFAASPCNTPCWLPECPTVPFDNSGVPFLKIVGVPMGGGQVKVKWVNRNSGIAALQVNVYDDATCSSLYAGGDPNPIQDLCGTGCLGNTCRGGEIIYTGPVGATVYFRLQVSTDIACSPLASIFSDCSTPVTIL